MSFFVESLHWYGLRVPAFLWLVLGNYINHIWNLYGITRHAKTLFVPWKRLVSIRQTRGLDFEDIIGVLSFNLISSVIGAIIRTATIFLGFIVMAIFFIAWLEFVVIWILAIPFFPLFFMFWSQFYPNIKKLLSSYQKSSELLVSHAGRDLRVIEVFVRLSFSNEVHKKIISEMKNASYLQDSDIDYRNIHTKSALLVTLLQKELSQKKHKELLTANRISKKDYETLCSWIIEDEEKKYNQKRFWTRTKLQESRSIGKDWAFGFTPTLDKYSTDIARATASSYKYDIHEEVTSKIEQTFSQPRSTSILLSGAPGIGKKTLIYFLAKRIFDGMTTPVLADHRVMLLDLDAVLSASESAEEKNSTLDQLLTEAHNAGNIILVIKNVDRYLQNSKKGTNLSTVFSSVGTQYNVKILMTTTQSHFKETVRADSLFLSSVTTIHIEPLGNSDTIKLLLHLLPIYESKRQFFTYRAIKEIVKYADDVYQSVPQPASSVRALELVAGKSVRDKLISSDDVDAVFSQHTNNIVGSLTKDQKDKLIALEKTLGETIVGQDHAMKQLANALKRSQLELTKKDKTMGAFLFLGATGVGKTETAKTLAKVLFDSPNNLIRIDCAEYVTAESLKGLIGSAEKANMGLLTEAVRKQPYSVVLLDEIEKAHPTIRLALMTVFDEGYLQNGKGEKISFKHTVIVSTSNAGSSYIYENIDQNPNVEQLIEHLVSNNILKPELINRFDGVVLYNPLSYEDVVEIAKRKLKSFSKKLLEDKSIKLEISEETFHKIYQEGYNQKFGARYLERTINKIVVDAVADELLKENIKAGGILKL